MKHFKFITIIIVIGIISSSCVALLGRRQTVYIDSQPQGAKVYAEGNYIGITPCAFRTKRVKKEFTFEKEGYESKTIQANTKNNNAIWWNTLFTGFIGVLVDIPYALKYAQTNYTTSLSILPPPSPIIESKSANSTTPNSTTPKERQANPSILAQIPISSSPKELKATQKFKKYNSAVFMIFTKDATNEYQGSGFFISEDGLAISNYHVFKGTHIGAEIIELYNGKQYKVKEVLAYSERYDYILFRIEGKFNYIPITQREYEVGEKVYAIGSPKGMENTFSSGEISQIRGNAIIQISVPIDHGSSGGALINSYGEVIGITSGGDDGSGANLNYAMDIRIIFNTKFKNEDY